MQSLLINKELTILHCINIIMITKDWYKPELSMYENMDSCY